MAIHAISQNPLNGSTTKPSIPSSKWNNRVVVDLAYNNKLDVTAGVGPGMFNGLGRAAITAAFLFAGLIASISVGIATGSLLSASITFGVVGACAALVNLIVYARDPKF